ncbi:unnamed protein product [Bursaphelenchus okinawaensis]|uniref:Uncharacterized protein n=1 Tax=Bursaphelenchus okinawaensis TaxID=465554 RepID=A0A811JX56_9BILA|nr:unnamed protein product [Bursaphelenchus okinawaensis]CAG9086696.1 unnamed protein product [Bursaphelenchus okinawaensis]
MLWERAAAFSEAFPTQVLSAYGARGRVTNGARVNDNEILAERVSQLQTAPPHDYNIGVIQVRLSNWTTTLPPRAPMTSALQSGPQNDETTRRTRSRTQPRRRKPADSAVQYDDDYFETTNKPKMAPIDNTFLYMLAAILLGLVLITTTIYSIMWCMSCRRSRPESGMDMPTMQFPSRYQYYDSSPWHGSEHRGSSEMERLYRSDLEFKRPPLVAPPPPPPRVPPPPVPQHLRPHPSWHVQSVREVGSGLSLSSLSP